MSTNKEEKQYGLILSKKQQPVPPKAGNIFGDDNDTDEEDGTDWVRKALKAEEEKNKIKKQTKLNMQKALKEDPTIYQYDEIYDDIERTKSQPKNTKEEKQRPKYIENLLKAAERRKKEQEHRIERMVQKEREAEGTMYADKESFVTSAYRAKLEEFKKMEEEESRMDRLEAIGDVRKQQDMSGFYRHLYEQTLNGPEECETKNNEANEDKINVSNNTENVNKAIDTSASNEEQSTSKKVKKSRQYRQRVLEEESDTDTESQHEVESETKVSVPETRKSIEKDEEEPNVKRQKQKVEEPEPDTTQNKITTEDSSGSKSAEDVPEKSENDAKAKKASITAKAKIEAEKRERSKIWEKRTVGPVFEAALQRYYARKAMRSAAA